MSHFFAFLDRMKFIRRWSLMRSVRDENIMEHSAQVAMLAHALALITNERCEEKVDVEKTVLYALYHESSEVMTGDLPTPIKYRNEKIRDSYHEIEAEACGKLLDMLPEPLRAEMSKSILPDADTAECRIMKCADKLSAYIKCLEELRAGNKEFSKAAATISRELEEKAQEFPALRYFMSEFIPSFALTLDELE